MTDKVRNEKEEADLLKGILRIDAKIFGLVLGVLFGLATFLATNWLVIKGGTTNEAGEVVIGPHLALLGQFFLGYRVSFVGSLIGFAYSFVLGSLTGWLISVIYNRVAGFRNG